MQTFQATIKSTIESIEEAKKAIIEMSTCQSFKVVPFCLANFSVNNEQQIKLHMVYIWGFTSCEYASVRVKKELIQFSLEEFIWFNFFLNDFWSIKTIWLQQIGLNSFLQRNLFYL